MDCVKPVKGKGLGLKNVWMKAVWQSAVIVLISFIAAFAANILRSDSLPLIFAWSSASRHPKYSGLSTLISLHEAEKYFLDNTAVFLDARSESNYKEGHIKGAISFPVENLKERFPEVMTKLQPETLIISYCDGENCMLSHDLAYFLRELGYKNIKVLLNGWTLWKQNKLPIEKGAVSS